MEGGCLGYPAASTVAIQPLDRILLPWLAKPRNPAMSPQSRHLSTLNESVEGKKERGWGAGMQTTIDRNLFKPPAPKYQLLEETPNALRLGAVLGMKMLFAILNAFFCIHCRVFLRLPSINNIAFSVSVFNFLTH